MYTIELSSSHGQCIFAYITMGRIGQLSSHAPNEFLVISLMLLSIERGIDNDGLVLHHLWPRSVLSDRSKEYFDQC